jgi:putative acetyltransferase
VKSAAGFLRIIAGDLDDPRVVALLERHLRHCRADTPPESVHALDFSGLRAPDVSFWTAWEGDGVVGTGALKRLAADHGEIKTMHTAAEARGRGVGRVMLKHIVAAARERGLARLSLETGAREDFKPAHALYRSHGFVDCPPFGDYAPDPHSYFLTLDLRGPQA